MLLDIIKGVGNQGVKFGHLIEYKVEVFFSKNNAENETKFQTYFCFFKKLYIVGKSKWSPS